MVLGARCRCGAECQVPSTVALTIYRCCRASRCCPWPRPWPVWPGGPRSDLGPIEERRDDQPWRTEVRHVEGLTHGDATVWIESNPGKVPEPAAVRQEVQDAAIRCPAWLVAIRELRRRVGPLRDRHAVGARHHDFRGTGFAHGLGNTGEPPTVRRHLPLPEVGVRAIGHDLLRLVGQLLQAPEPERRGFLRKGAHEDDCVPGSACVGRRLRV